MRDLLLPPPADVDADDSALSVWMTGKKPLRFAPVSILGNRRRGGTVAANAAKRPSSQFELLHHRWAWLI